VSWTLKNLGEVEDVAAKHGFGEFQEARFPGAELGAEATGLSHLRLRPGKRQPFAHRHNKAEEIYVVLAGNGRAKLDDEIVDLKPLDALRVAPGTTRGFQAGPDGLEVLAFGPRVPGDAEVVKDFWAD
jgi:mannose-6-phosphate isomerase-like protein (cupin superfamily)